MLGTRDASGQDAGAGAGDMVRIAVGTTYMIVLLMLVLRGMVRWPWRELVGWDDAVAVGAALVSLVQGALTIQASKRGLGSMVDQTSDSGVESCLRFLYASNLLFILVNYGAKLSVALSLCRLSNLSHGHQRLLTAILLASCGVFFVISFIVVAVQPGAPTPWMHNSGWRLSPAIGVWTTYAVLSDLLDIALALYPLYLIHNLKMASSSKWSVGISFGLRLILIILSAFRLSSLASAVSSDEVLNHYAWTEIWTQIEMASTLIFATIPCLRAFLLLAQTRLFDAERTESWATVRSLQSAEVGLVNKRSIESEYSDVAKKRKARGEPSAGSARMVARITAGRDEDGILRTVRDGAIEVRSRIEVERSPAMGP